MLLRTSVHAMQHNDRFALPHAPNIHPPLDRAPCMTSCTSIDVRPVPGAQTIKSVSIRENPKVAVSDFVDVLVAGFLRHGINARVITATAESKDEYVCDLRGLQEMGHGRLSRRRHNQNRKGRRDHRFSYISS